jgi:DeoR family fructose operon transcriptional repressor
LENFGVFAQERQQAISRLAREHGRVDVVALAQRFAVTGETIRRDLTVLESSGVLRRVHGGAMPIERLAFEPGLATRDMVMTAEKGRIAQAALVELPEEGAILLDAGSTTRRLAEALPADRELVVVVNSPPLANILALRPNLTVMMLGGRMRSRTLAIVDDWALQSLARLRVDVAFIATNGFSTDYGLTTPDPAEAAVKRAMIGAARRVVLLADNTKLDNDKFAQFGTLGDVDLLISDTGLDEDAAAGIEAAGPRVVRA